MALVGQYTKEPYEVLPISVNFTAELTGDSISTVAVTSYVEGTNVSSTTTIISGTPAETTPGSKIVVATVKAGTSGSSHILNYQITTALGKKYESSVRLFILEPTTLAAYALATVAEVKDILQLGSGITRDTALARIINAATLAIEKFTHSIFVYDAGSTTERSFTYQVSAGDQPYGIGSNWIYSIGYRRIYLEWMPLRSITSIADPAGNTVASTDYAVFHNWGYLEGAFPVAVDSNGFPSYWTVTYKAGRYANTAAVPDDLKQAVAFTAGDWLQHKSGGSGDVIRKAVGDLSIEYADTSSTGTKDTKNLIVPEKVYRMLSPYMHVTAML